MPVNVTLFRKGDFADVTGLRQDQWGGPQCNMTGVLIRRENKEIREENAM